MTTPLVTPFEIIEKTMSENAKRAFDHINESLHALLGQERGEVFFDQTEIFNLRGIELTEYDRQAIRALMVHAGWENVCFSTSTVCFTYPTSV